jgi:hypothetical protein
MMKMHDLKVWREWFGSCIEEMRRTPMTSADRAELVALLKGDVESILTGPEPEPSVHDCVPQEDPWGDLGYR